MYRATYRFPAMLCFRIGFHLSVRRVVSTVIIVGSALFYFLLRPIWARALGIGNEGGHQLQDILFAGNVGKRVVAHRFLEVDGVENLDLIAIALEHLAAFNDHAVE